MQTSYAVTAQYYDKIYSVKGLTDLPFYLELASRTSGPVLELGAGTGRISIPLAQAGCDVTALDIDTQMLDQLQAKLGAESAEVLQRVSLVQGNMAHFDLGRQFALILMPFRGFQHLLTPAEQRSCLQSVARHLAPGGRFVFDSFYPDFELMARRAALAGAFTPDLEYRDALSGATLQRYASIKARFSEQINEVLFRYELAEEDGNVVSVAADRIFMRWQTRWECEYLLELCGLSIEEAYGSFDGRSLDDNPRELIYVCSKSVEN